MSSKRPQKNIFTVAFYNVENLFDTKNNPNTFDDDFTPKGRKNWNYKRYKDKIKKLTSVISQLGTDRSFYAPALVGLVEVENAQVVADLVNHSNLKKHHYDFVHYDSPDERGIDVALLFNKQLFEYLSSETIPVFLENEKGERDYTRDILLVKGKLKGELIHVLVNHWSSRREGAAKTEHNRIIAAKTAREIIETIQAENKDARFFIMGDFNDDPTSKSIKQHLVTEDFYNPMEYLLDRNDIGSLTYENKWNLFDQIIFNKSFLEKSENKLHFLHTEIYNKDWLKIYKGKLKGSPFRTYIGPWYQGGFSDHFPVYSYFEKR